MCSNWLSFILRGHELMWHGTLGNAVFVVREINVQKDNNKTIKVNILRFINK